MVVLLIYTETERIQCEPYGHRVLLCIVSGFKGIKEENMDFKMNIKNEEKWRKQTSG
jgi:hypothetical protein